jgi:hypothetical protein
MQQHKYLRRLFKKKKSTCVDWTYKCINKAPLILHVRNCIGLLAEVLQFLNWAMKHTRFEILIRTTTVSEQWTIPVQATPEDLLQLAVLLTLRLHCSMLPSYCLYADRNSPSAQPVYMLATMTWETKFSSLVNLPALCHILLVYLLVYLGLLSRTSSSNGCLIKKILLQICSR